MTPTVWDGTTETTAAVAVWDGTTEHPTDTHTIPYGYHSVTDMLSRDAFYVAHRGGSRDWPEMTGYAYTKAAQWGAGALEVSCGRTVDGVWFGLHDQGLTRTSGPAAPTSVAAELTWAQVQQSAVNGSVAANNPTQPPRPYTRLEEILGWYGGSHVLFLDPKYETNRRHEFFDLVGSLMDPSRVVIKFYGDASFLADDARARGFASWGYYYQSDWESGMLAEHHASWDILGMDYEASPAAWAAVMAYGQPVMGHIVPDFAAAGAAIGYGAAGLMVSGVTAVVDGPAVPGP